MEMSGMSVKDLKEELARMGLSTADCLDRADLAAKLGNARTARGGVGAARSTAAGGQAETNPFASLAFGLQGVFDSVGTSCKGVMDKLKDKFDAIDSRLDDLEGKKRHLDQTIATKEPTTALGRLNQLKAKAGAREMSERLSETKIETREEKKALTAKVAQESAGIVQGLMPAMMMPKK